MAIFAAAALATGAGVHLAVAACRSNRTLAGRLTTQRRAAGDSQAVIVPREELERVGIPEGATVSVEVSVSPVLSRQRRDVSERALAWGAGLR